MKKNSISGKKDFPIWEKVYLDSSVDDYWGHVKGIQVKNLVYIFSSLPLQKVRHYHILDLESESIIKESVEKNLQDLEGLFNPVYDNDKTIYLFKLDSSPSSDFRYNLVSFNTETRSFNLIQAKGSSPKKRAERITTCYYEGKIFFMGGSQLFPGDNTGSILYSFDVGEGEWNIESYFGTFPSGVMKTPYLSNRSGMGSIILGEKLIIVGGKSLVSCNLENLKEPSGLISSQNIRMNDLTDMNCTCEGCSPYSQKGQNCINTFNTFNTFNSLNSLNSLNDLSPFFKYVISDEIFEFDLVSKKISKKNYIKAADDLVFFNSSLVYHSSSSVVYLHDGENLFSLDSNFEMTMIKPLLFTPKTQCESTLFIYKDIMYFLGKVLYTDDCFLFKTSLDNLVAKWPAKKDISYEMLLNNKDCSDIVFVLSAGEKNREIHVNKKVMFNFSLPLKNIITNLSQNSNYYNFNDVSFIGVYNTLKFIYSNFNENISSYDPEILQEMIDIIIRYRAKSLLMTMLAYLNITNENALALYDLGCKFNLKEFKERVYNYISENIQSIQSLNPKTESSELRKLLYENFFCSHMITVVMHTQGWDIRNVTGSRLSQEKFTEIKQLCIEEKIVLCINCKRIVEDKRGCDESETK